MLETKARTELPVSPTCDAFTEFEGTAARLGDSFSHAASATVVLMMISNSIVTVTGIPEPASSVTSG